MPMNFNSFSSNPGSNSSLPLQLSSFDFIMNQDGRGFDVQRLVNNSNNRQNPANYGQNNELIAFQRGMSRSQIGLGQLRLRQRISDGFRRNNYPSPHRVQVQNFIDYVPVARQPGVSEVTVTKVVKTKFLASNSTRDRLLAPNDHFISAARQEPNFPRASLPMSNQPFKPYDEGDGSLWDAIFHQGRIQNQSYNLPNTNMFTMNDPLAARKEQPFHNIYHGNFTQNQASSARNEQPFHNIYHGNFTQNQARSVRNEQPFHNIYHGNFTQNQASSARKEQPFHNIYHGNFTQNQASSPRMSTTMSAKVNSPFIATDQTFQNICIQNPTQNQPNPNFINLGDPSLTVKNDETPDPWPVNVPVEHQDENQLDDQLEKPVHELLDDQLEKPVHELLDEYYRNLVGNYSAPLKKTPRSKENVRISYFVKTSDEDQEEDETEARNDGRIHSLYRQKNGPYTCPKCKEVFLTSQLFAAHVAASHYRFETFAERKKRLAAKYKKKNLRLVHSREGITIASDQSFRKIIQRRKAERAEKTNSDRRVQREKGKNIVAETDSEKCSHVDVEIKKEYE